jgi:hypothetical protein
MTKDLDNAWLYDPGFWDQVDCGPFSIREKEVIAALSRQTNVPEARLHKRLDAYWRGRFAKEIRNCKFAVHYSPGNETIN